MYFLGVVTDALLLVALPCYGLHIQLVIFCAIPRYGALTTWLAGCEPPLFGVAATRIVPWLVGDVVLSWEIPDHLAARSSPICRPFGQVACSLFAIVL